MVHRGQRCCGGGVVKDYSVDSPLFSNDVQQTWCVETTAYSSLSADTTASMETDVKWLHLLLKLLAGRFSYDSHNL